MEERDVSADHTELVRRLRTALDRALDSWRAWGDDAEALTPQEAEEIEDHLSALGYI